VYNIANIGGGGGGGGGGGSTSKKFYFSPGSANHSRAFRQTLYPGDLEFSFVSPLCIFLIFVGVVFCIDEQHRDVQ